MDRVYIKLSLYNLRLLRTICSIWRYGPAICETCNGNKTSVCLSMDIELLMEPVQQVEYYSHVGLLVRAAVVVYISSYCQLSQS